MNIDLFKIAVCSFLKYKDMHDDRIFVIPKEIKFNIKKCDLKPRIKVIRVPNGTQYSDLSKYLNQAHDREQKVLSKTL